MHKHFSTNRGSYNQYNKNLQRNMCWFYIICNLSLCLSQISEKTRRKLALVWVALGTSRMPHTVKIT